MKFIFFFLQKKNILIQQPFMGAPRYPSGPRPGVRMPQGIGNDFNGVSLNKNKKQKFGNDFHFIFDSVAQCHFVVERKCFEMFRFSKETNDIVKRNVRKLAFFTYWKIRCN